MLAPAAISDLSNNVQDAMAPAFVLAAMGGWVSAMSLRLARLTDRMRYLIGLEKTESIGQPATAELADLKKIVTAIEYAMLLMTSGAICIVIFVVLAFLLAIFSLHYGRVIIFVFVLALTFSLVSLAIFAWTVWLRSIKRRWP